MASTRLVRKALRNRTVSRQRVNRIKRLTSKPVIKNVDIEQIKAEFANIKAKPAVKEEAPAKEAPKAQKEVVKSKKAETTTAPEVKEEKKAAPKKAVAKKTTAKVKTETKTKANKEDKAAK